MKKNLLSAFTLIELLVVIAILAALATITIINFSGAQDTAKDAKRKSDLRQYQTAVEIYANDNNGNFPIRSSAVDADSLCTPADLGDLTCPQDSQAAHQYKYISNAGGTSYVLYFEMERPVDPSLTYFVMCSNGTTGESGSASTNGSCPI